MTAGPSPPPPNRQPAASGVSPDFAALMADIRSCTVCAPHLPLGPRPVVRGQPAARLLIISQAPGTRVHATGLSFDDRSGDRLRLWLGLDRAAFYDEHRVAIMGVGFCYPGRLPRGGDRPPRRECAPLWHARLRAQLSAIELTVLAGRSAIDYYLPSQRQRPLSETLANWRDFLPEYFVLPHPSWRSALWQRDNPWFDNELLPALRAHIAGVLSGVEAPAGGPVGGVDSFCSRA